MVKNTSKIDFPKKLPFRTIDIGQAFLYCIAKEYTRDIHNKANNHISYYNRETDLQFTCNRDKKGNLWVKRVEKPIKPKE